MKSKRLQQTVLILGVAGLPLQASIGDTPLTLSPAAASDAMFQTAVETALDSDNGADPAAVFIANDTATTAQTLANPVTLTGYVNQPGSGSEGQSRAAGDLVDVYRVNLNAGDRVTLTIAGDGVQDDLELGMADLEGHLLDASTGQGRVEALTVKADGEALVLVGAHRGASRYELTLGAARGPLPFSLRLSDRFAPGEVIVRFLDQPEETRGGLRTLARALGKFAGRERETRQRNTLLELAELKQAQVERSPTRDDSSSFPGGFQPTDPATQTKLDTLHQVKALTLDPEVASAEPNYIRHILFTPNDPYYKYQWHYTQINLPQTWDITTGANAIVAVIDTGVALGHPDLQGQLVAGYDFVRDPANAGDGDGIDPNPNDPGDHSNSDGSSSFHGTHVTGTVVAATNNAVGGSGVAFGARVMPLRVCGRSDCNSYDIEQAVRFAAGLANDSGTVPARRADVINASLGGATPSPTEQSVYSQALAAGVIIVAAAGNDGTNEMNYPAALNGVIAVGAVDSSKARATYSNFGSWVTLVAPGGNARQDVNGDGQVDGVLSTVAKDTGGTLVYDYELWQGTSMATPHVAGVMALMKAVAPSLTPQTVMSLLTSGALTDDLGAAGKDDQFGYGLINASKAVAAVGGNPGSGAFKTIDSSLLGFGVNVGTMVPIQ